MMPTFRFVSHRLLLVVLFAACLVLTFFTPQYMLHAQEYSPEMLKAASQKTGLSEQELVRRYEQKKNGVASQGEVRADSEEPGRTGLDDINDSLPASGQSLNIRNQRFIDSREQVILPYSEVIALEDSLLASIIEESLSDSTRTHFFGDDFFHLDEGLFTPPSFGPVSDDYRLGVGDEIIINIWGGVDLQLTRVVDRDGSVILPRVGKIACAGRTLGAVDSSIRKRLAQSHSSITLEGDGSGQGGETYVEVTMGHLRAIRVFVVGQVARPGSYELSSVSTVLTALYVAGGPSDKGTFRSIDIVRGGKSVGSFDLYTYLLGGSRTQDVMLQEGDTVYVRDRGASVEIFGGVRRAMFYEMKPEESLADLIKYAGGFSASAAPEVVHISRIVPVALREVGQPDQVFLDVAFNAAEFKAADGNNVPLYDGDIIRIDEIGDRLENWVEVVGSVKRPGIYEFREGMTVIDLVEVANGIWPDALTERAVIDRTSPEKEFSSLALPLDKVLAGSVAPVKLQAMDVLHVFSRWEILDRPQVHIAGEVYEVTSIDFRKGMTLTDLILKAGGMKDGADWMRADVARLQMSSLRNTDTSIRPEQTTKILQIELGADFLTSGNNFLLQPHDRVSIRRLPWWEMQETVTIRGEVFYPGVFSLERNDERLSSIIERAGGVQPDAYLLGARVVRQQDGVGNIAIELQKALAEPGSSHDIVLQEGDVIIIPDQMFTVKVIGEVGFPTSLIYEAGKNINYYVDHAGGYLEKADKDKTRVVYPNGMSLPNKGGSLVVAGSTIIVPVEPPPEGKTWLETIRDITAIVSSLAMVWLVIDNSK